MAKARPGGAGGADGLGRAVITVGRFDEPSQSTPVVEGYRQTALRTPAEPLIERPFTLSELTGPDRPERRLALLGTDLAGHGAQRAMGQLIDVRLRVLDEDGAPLPGALVEMWQANAAGRYIHPNDDDHAPVDPHFYGAARMTTDAAGCLSIRTIKPGAYPVPGSGRWWRPPHIHFSLWGRVWMSRLVTQMFFPGEPLNGQDRILHAVPVADARERLICRPRSPVDGPDDTLVFDHDIVVRGRRATPVA